MIVIGFMVVLTSIGFLAHTYLGYPLLLKVLSLTGPERGIPKKWPGEWLDISITIPAYNEEVSIRDTLEGVLALDYPAGRRHILVVSDASTDRTDEIVREYADRGVELLRLPKRSGKTAAENAARTRLKGEIIVNTDASVWLHHDALKPLVAAFNDPTVGVASGRDVSVGRQITDPNIGSGSMWATRCGCRTSRPLSMASWGRPDVSAPPAQPCTRKPCRRL